MKRVRLSRQPASFLALILTISLSVSAGTGKAPAAAHANEFIHPQRVTIRGYDADAMEPFLSRDGRYLFFNNLNDPSVNTDLYWAERIDDLLFQFKGPIGGVNTPALEGVASMDRDGNFYFISTRSYEKTASTIYRARFANGSLTAVELVPGVSLAKPGIVNFDAEISADGDTLYYVESQFDHHGHAQNASILFARRSGGAFQRSDDSARIMKAVNTATLNYAPATTASGLELFFTRLDSHGPAIYYSNRTDVASPFASPRKVEAITGFAEAPTLSPDARALYYHVREGARFVIYRVTRD